MLKEDNTFSKDFLEEIKGLNISEKQLKNALNIISKKYHENETEPHLEILDNKITKMILNVMRFTSGKKLKNFSDNFLIQMMDVDLEKPQLYALLEVVNKHYNDPNQNNKLRKKII